LISDPYLYPGTSVLRNHRCLRDHEKLSKFERRETASAINDLRKNPVDGDFDYAHLREIHRRIFDKVYPFAGETRLIDMSKSEPVLNGASVNYSYADDITKHVVLHLKAMNGRDWSNLRDMNQPEKMETFAKDVAELWRIHPFREGNTRTTMTFMAQFAHERGFSLDRGLFARNAEFTRKALVVATYDHPEHLTRILTDSRNIMLGRETDMATRIAGWAETRDPELKGAASKLALVEAELRHAGVGDKDRQTVRGHAAHSLAREVLHGKVYEVEKLAARSIQRPEQAKEKAPDRGRGR